MVVVLAIYVVVLLSVCASDFFGYISIDAMAAATAVLLLATTTIKSCKYVAFIRGCCFFVVFIKFFT